MGEKELMLSRLFFAFKLREV